MTNGLERLELAYDRGCLKGNQTVQIRTPDAASVLRINGKLPSKPVELIDGKLKRIEVKFYFTNPKHIPSVIPFRPREVMLKSGERSARIQKSLGQVELAKFERHRANHFDTGEPVINNLRFVQVGTLRKGFTNINLLLKGCFYYELSKRGQQTKFVVVLQFGFEHETEAQQIAVRTAQKEANDAFIEAMNALEKVRNEATLENWKRHEETAIRSNKALQASNEARRCLHEHYHPKSLDLNSETTNALRTLARTTWGVCHVWKNPDSTVTINMLHLEPQGKPAFALAVRDRKLAVLDVNREITENEEF